MRDAIVLFEAGTFGTTFVRKLHRALRKIYTPLPDDEIQARRVWVYKMLERIQVGDVEAHYRRSWLHQALLIDYFEIRGQRYWGPKEALAHLKRFDPTTFRLFKNALEDPTDLKVLRRLVAKVAN